jgi:hypothetical protein
VGKYPAGTVVTVKATPDAGAYYGTCGRIWRRPNEVGLTGDSAGGHLSAFAALATNMIGSRGFGKTPGVFEFKPTYLPKNKSVEQVRTGMTAAINSDNKRCASRISIRRLRDLLLTTPALRATPPWKTEGNGAVSEQTHPSARAWDSSD